MRRFERHGGASNGVGGLNALQANCLGTIASGKGVDRTAADFGLSGQTVMLVLDSCKVSLECETLAGAVAYAVAKELLG